MKTTLMVDKTNIKHEMGKNKNGADRVSAELLLDGLSGLRVAELKKSLSDQS